MKLDFVNKTLQIIKSKVESTLTPKYQKYFKKGLISFAVVFATYILVLVGITFLIDPNQYKESIQRVVLEQSGKALILNGPLSLHCFPTFSLQAQDVIFKKNTKIKSILMKAGSIKIYPKFLPLLFGTKKCSIELKDLRLKKLSAAKFFTKIKYTKDNLEFSNIKIDLLKGKKQGTFVFDQIKIDLEKNIPKYHLKHKGDKLDLALLLGFLGSETIISGNTKINLDLHAEGKTLAPIKRTLTGTLAIDIQKGKIYGIDLIDSLREAKSMLETITHKLSQTLTSAFDTLFHRKHTITGVTPFDVIKIKANIHKGIVHTEILKVKHRHYHLKGKGHINLPANTIHYQVEALYKEKGVLKEKLSANKLPPLIINITGSCTDPNIKPDMQSYLQYVRSGDGTVGLNQKSKNHKKKRKKHN